MYFTRHWITTLIAVMLLSTCINSAHSVVGSQTNDYYNLTQPNVPKLTTNTAGALAVSIEMERDAFAPLYRGACYNDPSVLRDPLLASYLNNLGKRLMQAYGPFAYRMQFYVKQDEDFNAMAYIGGQVVVHTSLLGNLTDSEDELAAILAHEVSHITQRHMARQITAQKQREPLQVLRLMGALGTLLINPSLAATLIPGTHYLELLYQVAFSQDLEREADNCSLNLLKNAGFNPMAAAEIWERMAGPFSSQRLVTPEFLRTHPFPETRATENRQRALQLGCKRAYSSIDYWFAKIRTLVLYYNLDAVGLNKKQLRERLEKMLEPAMPRHRATALLYCKALRLIKDGNPEAALKIAQNQIKRLPSNLWWLHLVTELELQLQPGSPQTVKRLEKAYAAVGAEQVVVLQLANVYLATKSFDKAARLLQSYVHTNSTDLLAWNLLADVFAQKKERIKELQAQAEASIILLEFIRAKQQLKEARRLTDNPNVAAACDARIDAIENLSKRILSVQEI